MKYLVGYNLEKVKELKELEIMFKEVFRNDKQQICLYEFTNVNYRKLWESKIPEESFTDINAYWRYSPGSVLDEKDLKSIIIDNTRLLAWTSPSSTETEFKDLWEYMESGLEISLVRNMEAVTRDIARLNNYKLTDFYNKFGLI